MHCVFAEAFSIEMKRNKVTVAVAFELYLQEPRNYITEILTISLAFKPCACNKLMTSLPP